MKVNYYLLWVSFLLLTVSCSKETGQTPSISDQKNAVVSGLVKHHDAFIPGAEVLIKFNSPEFPGTNSAVYDDRTLANSNGFYELKKLPMGTHFLYSFGFDSSINEMVMGGIPVAIKVSGEKRTIDIPVTE